MLVKVVLLTKGNHRPILILKQQLAALSHPVEIVLYQDGVESPVALYILIPHNPDDQLKILEEFGLVDLGRVLWSENLTYLLPALVADLLVVVR